MALTGLDPTSPLPGTFRELIFAAGPSNTSGKSRDVLIYGNKTSAGSETVNTLGTPVLDDADAVARFGRRSEWYNSYKKYVAVDPGATIYGIAITESAGSAATCDFTFATTATDTTSVEISFQGEKVYATVNSGDTVTTIAAAVSAAINAAAEGSWQCSSSPSVGVVTVTLSQKGPRFDNLLGSSSILGMRMRFLKNVTTTVTKGALTGGATADDNTAALAAASAAEIYYQCSGFTSTTTVTATDNAIGEHIDMIRTQALPVNGKSMVAAFGLVGTQAQATAVAISSAANSVRGFFFHQENSDWSPGMIAAHHLAVMRSQQIAHPAANLTGYASTDATIYQMPVPYTAGDRPTTTEQIADLNNGVCPVAFTSRGAPYLVRHVTSRSLNAQGNNDYRAREGHVTSVMDFAWETVKARWESQKQPFCADDPIKGAKPLPKVSTPSQVKGIITSVIDDLTSGAPLGLYTGPILNPSPAAVKQMKDSIVVVKSTGGFSAACDFLAVEHNNRAEYSVREVSPAY